MRCLIVIIGQVRVEDIPLPIPSQDAARALEMCTSMSVIRSRDAPVLEGMMPPWNHNLEHNAADIDVAEVAGDDTGDPFPALVCESRAVRDLVQLCILRNVSSVNNVLLMTMPQQPTPLRIFAYIQVSYHKFLFFCNCQSACPLKFSLAQNNWQRTSVVVGGYTRTSQVIVMDPITTPEFY